MSVAGILLTMDSETSTCDPTAKQHSKLVAIVGAAVACALAAFLGSSVGSSWMHGHLAPSSVVSFENLQLVDTSSFGRAVADTSRSRLPLVVAFYDPASEAIRDLRPHLDAAAQVPAPISRVTISVKNFGFVENTSCIM